MEATDIKELILFLIMESIKKYSFKNISKMIIGHTVHFISDCEIIKNFNVTVKVLSTDISGNEIIINTKRSDGKKLTIGSNMKNLKFEIIS